MFKRLYCNNTGLENNGGSAPLPKILGGGGATAPPSPPPVPTPMPLQWKLIGDLMNIFVLYVELHVSHD